MLGIRSWFGVSGISVLTLDFPLLVCRVCFWIPFCAFVTVAGGSFFQFSYSSLQLVVHPIILFGLRHFLSYYVRHGDCHSTAAELLTDAQASKLVPTSIHSIRVGDQRLDRMFEFTQTRGGPRTSGGTHTTCTFSTTTRQRQGALGDSMAI